MEKGQLIARGRTAEVYQWGNDRVLKLFYSWCPDEWANGEAALSAKIVELSVPAPACFGLAEIEGRKGIVFQRLQGETYINIISHNLFSLFRYARKMAKLHYQILTLEDTSFPSLKVRLHKIISNLTILSPEIKRFCLQSLAELPDGKNICHCDFHPDQIMQTSVGDYVIDWGSVCSGDACADIARTSFLLNKANVGHMPWIVRNLTGLLRNRMHQIYMKEIRNLYEGIDLIQIEKWKIPIYAARLNENVEGENQMILSFLEKAYSKAHSK